MNVRRFQGWALIVSALTTLLGLFNLLGSSDSILLRIIGLIGAVLFIIGLPAIQALQPQTGRAGQVGLILLGIAAVIALMLGLLSLSDSHVDISSIVPFLSALAGLLGSLLVGWTTTQARVFPAWVGWLLILAGLLNFVGGLLSVEFAGHGSWESVGILANQPPSPVMDGVLRGVRLHKPIRLQAHKATLCACNHRRTAFIRAGYAQSGVGVRNP